VRSSPGWILFTYRRGAEHLLAGVSHGIRTRRVILGGSWRSIETDPCASFVAACEGTRARAIFREKAPIPARPPPPGGRG